MELLADSGKVVKAYQIINQQLVHEMQKKRIELRMHEERYNATNEMLLRERQENKALRDMVRKLKDQMQVITKVIVSVQEQTESVYERINRPHEQAERMMQNYTPRAPQVYERRRTENPPYVDEYAIAEEHETSIVVENEPLTEANAPESNDDTRANESNADGNETFATNRSSEVRCSNGGAPLPMGSPLVQRLKRPSRNASFDESFETIDCERAFKLSRHSQDRRKLYANMDENGSALESVGSAAAHMDIDEELSETLRNLSPVKLDDHSEDMSCESVEGTKNSEEQRPSHPSISLKKMASESMLPRIHRSPVAIEDVIVDRSISNVSRDEIEMTDFNPADLVASCSTPVAKGSAIDERSIHADKDRELSRGGRGRARGRPRGRGRPTKSRSETELHRVEMNPVVVLRPLTEKNIQAFEQKMQPYRKARPLRSMKDRNDSGSDEGSTMGDGNTWEPSSSLENLSTLSGESNRPRRKAAPKILREPLLNSKLRRA